MSSQLPEAVREATASDVLDRVRAHRFAPVEGGYTIDPERAQHGIADLSDESWRVRLLAVRDLVRLSEEAAAELLAHLHDADPQVRQVTAMALGVRQSGEAAAALEDRLTHDPVAFVRAQAALSLGQVGLDRSLGVLHGRRQADPNDHVVHRTELAINQIESGQRPGPLVARSFAELDERRFRTAQVGRRAPDFELVDTGGRPWRLSEFRGKRPVLLIWVFADWCPVCHHEFADLIRLESEFSARGIEVATVECHEPYRCRVMTAQERQPRHTSAATPPDVRRDGIWWRHLSDPGGAVAATYGADPLEFVVHEEWINRPSTFFVDEEGVLRFAYAGTFWGDRPSIEETVEMIVSERFEFVHPRRLRPRTARTRAR